MKCISCAANKWINNICQYCGGEREPPKLETSEKASRFYSPFVPMEPLKTRYGQIYNPHNPPVFQREYIEVELYGRKIKIPGNVNEML